MNSELAEFFSKIPAGKRLFNDALNTFSKVWKPVTKILVTAGVKYVLKTDLGEIEAAFSQNPTNNDPDESSDSGKLLEDTSKKLDKAIEAALKEHSTTKNAISEFKTKLTLLIDELEKASGIELPLFIFIDELDRCRPDYAIELLEGIKHLFGVKGIYFVVATNISQLSESVKAVYGSGFDGERYLKRFF